MDINIGVVVVGVVLALLYLLPSYLAFTREVKGRWLVLVINLFLGASLIGWGVALHLALRKPSTVTVAAAA
ncbi:superinfection immunity protein [Streptomyces sp. NPDC004539]|uniref:superinfection immunity protein n=1 Tax=Streptomyces sp. NPDC004539 TaxID=3154280 RepID=UPI0033A74ACE